MATANNAEFEIAPAGPTAARCIDVVDLGLIWSDFYKKAAHKIEVYWVTSHERQNDEGMIYVRKRYTLSLHENAMLSKDLIAWRGKPFTAEESSGFDVENLIGAPCLINVVHNQNGQNVYANVNSVMPLPKGMPAPEVPGYYVRHIDRNPSKDYRSPNYQGDDDHSQAPATPKGADTFEPDDDLPF